MLFRSVFDATVKATSKGVTLGPRSTGASGEVGFEAACGTWEITVTKEGFETALRNTEMTSGATVDLRVVIEPQAQSISVDVEEKAPPVEQSATQSHELKPAEVKTLPSDPATVNETLPLVPGIVRTPDGELKIDGNGQERSAMVVNLTDITDPATGKFGQGVPIDAVETVNVLTTPFLAQYGRFTQSVVAVETKRGGDKWHADIKDPFPDFRIRSYHMRGIRNETPRFTTGGPLIKDKFYFAHAMQYFMEKAPNRTLPFPFNESKTEWINSFSQFDWNISQRQLLTATFHFAPQKINFVNPEYFNPRSEEHTSELQSH